MPPPPRLRLCSQEHEESRGKEARKEEGLKRERKKKKTSTTSVAQFFFFFLSLTESRMQRVKVYRLNPEGLWDDKGTGSVSIEYLEVRMSRRERASGE